MAEKKKKKKKKKREKIKNKVKILILVSRFWFIKGPASLNAAPKLFRLSLSILLVDTPHRWLPTSLHSCTLPPSRHWDRVPSRASGWPCDLLLQRKGAVTIPCLLGWDLTCLSAPVFVLKEGAATMLERGHEGKEVLEERGVSPASPWLLQPPPLRASDAIMRPPASVESLS